MQALSLQSITASIPSNSNTKTQSQLSNQGILHQFIQKKTKRGRKSKTELPQEEKCQLCFEFINHSIGKLIKCRVCLVKFHSECYKHPISNTDAFICERCHKAKEEKKAIDSYKCFICNRPDGVLYEQGYTGELFHQVCLRFIPELIEASHDEYIAKPKIRRWRYKNSCRYCREKLSSSKAVIKCSNPKCKCFFHIPCAIQKGTIFSIKYCEEYFNIKDDKVPLPFFCCGHNKRLVASYRKDVIEQNIAFDSANNIKDFLSAKTELSAKETTEELSELNNDNGNDDDEIENDNRDYTNVFCNKNNNNNNDNNNANDNDNDDLLTNQTSKALNLNFNEMIDESQFKLDNESNSVNNITNYTSPKYQCLFDFNYEETNTDDFSPVGEDCYCTIPIHNCYF